MIKYMLMTIAYVGIFTSCSPKLSPFTDTLNDSYDWTENDLKQVQFYLSKDINLYREVGNEESEIIDGDIRIKEGRKVEEIRFRKGTPGVILFTPKSDRFAVSFEEEGDDNKYLMFGPSDKAGGRFVLLAKKWKKRYGEITYNNKIYTTGTQSAFASLMVDLDEAKRTTYERKRVKGRTIH